MSIDKRRYLYKVEEVDGRRELDYLDTSLLRMNIEPSEVFRITTAYRYRPDLISYRFYENFHFAWLIMDYNGILDPFEELDVGRVIEIPDLSQYYSFFNRNSR